jgi:hypothetical protein
MPEDFLPGLLETLELRMIKPGKANPLTGLLTSPGTLGAGSQIGYTDEQGQFQVTNPEARKVFFDRFFEGSKVVDDEGNPLMVFHGTPSESINIFDSSRLGENTGATSMEGFFFSGNYGTAEEYKKSDWVLKPEHQERFDALSDEKDKIEKKFGEPQGSKGLWYEIDKNKHPEEAARVRQINQQFNEIFSDQEMQRPKYWMKKTFGQVIPAYLSIKNPFVFDADGSAWTPDLDKKINAMMRETAKEYDGIIIKNIYDSETGIIDDTYIVRDPAQIKSAEGNRGTFDPQNPDIYSMNVMNKGLLAA